MIYSYRRPRYQVSVYRTIGPLVSKVFSQTSWPIKAKCYVAPPCEGEKKVYINGPGHITNMGVTPIYGKNLKNLIQN